MSQETATVIAATIGAIASLGVAWITVRYKAKSEAKPEAKPEAKAEAKSNFNPGRIVGWIFCIFFYFIGVVTFFGGAIEGKFLTILAGLALCLLGAKIQNALNPFL